MIENDNIDFDKWSSGVSEDIIEDLISITKKQYYKWLLLSLIPIINWFTMGKAIYCYNNINYMKSRGHSTGSILWRLVLVIWGLIIFPFILVMILSNNEKRGNIALGWI